MSTKPHNIYSWNKRQKQSGVQEAEAAPGRGGKKKLDILKELVPLNLRDTRFDSQGKPNLSLSTFFPGGPLHAGP